MDANHEKFLSHLDASSGGVSLAKAWLESRGHEVSIRPSGRAEARADWKNHADNGDLTISLRVEVKQLGCDFTCEADWPFRDKFIVCAKHAFDRAKPKPYGFIIINRAGTHAAFVLCSDARHWTVERRKDSRYDGVEQDFYLSPLPNVKFGQLNP